MTYIDYLRNRSMIEDEIRSVTENLRIQLRELEKRYISEQCPVKLGWVIENKSRNLRLKVERIDPIGLDHDAVMWKLTGTAINKDGSVSKKHVPHHHSFTAISDKDFIVIDRS